MGDELRAKLKREKKRPVRTTLPSSTLIAFLFFYKSSIICIPSDFPLTCCSISPSPPYMIFGLFKPLPAPQVKRIRRQVTRRSLWILSINSTRLTPSVTFKGGWATCLIHQGFPDFLQICWLGRLQEVVDDVSETVVSIIDEFQLTLLKYNRIDQKCSCPVGHTVIHPCQRRAIKAQLSHSGCSLQILLFCSCFCYCTSVSSGYSPEWK